MEELLNLAVGPPEIAKLVFSLFIYRNPDVLFLWGLRVMFLEGDESRGQRLVEEAMKAGNPRGTYLFCMLALLSSPHLDSDEVERVLGPLGSLKEKEDMVWLRKATIRHFGLA